METFIIQGEILATFEDEGRAFVVVKDQRGDRIIVAVADAKSVET